MSNKDTLIRETIKQILKEEYSLKTEMARSLKAELNRIDNLAENIIYEHLLKCFLYRSKHISTLHHWESEIYANLHFVSKVKTTNNYPTYEQLMKNCFYTWSDTIKDRLKYYIIEFNKQYGNNDDINEDDILDLTTEYFSWLFKKLSTDGAVTSDEVYEQVDDLISKLN